MRAASFGSNNRHNELCKNAISLTGSLASRSPQTTDTWKGWTLPPVHDIDPALMRPIPDNGNVRFTYLTAVLLFKVGECTAVYVCVKMQEFNYKGFLNVFSSQ
jgi:hypothetical protein